jgi:hypothetical protein
MIHALGASIAMVLAGSPAMNAKSAAVRDIFCAFRASLRSGVLIARRAFGQSRSDPE